MAPVTAKESDSEVENEAFGANIHLAVRGCDDGPPFVSCRIWRGESEGGAEDRIKLRNPDQELFPIPPELRQPPCDIHPVGWSLKEFLDSRILNQPIRLGEGRENAYGAVALTTLESANPDAQCVAGLQPGQISRVIAKRPEGLDRAAMRARPGWANLTLEIILGVLLRTYRDCLDHLQTGRRQSAGQREPAFVATDRLLHAGASLLAGGRILFSGGRS